MILVFSGTGNSFHIANLLSENLGDEVIRLPLKTNKIECEDNRIIWVFPIYSWGVPPVVLKWISELEIIGAEKAVHHLVCTCGDDIGQADLMWRKAIERKGWGTASAFSVQMPNTYVLMRGFNVDPIDVEKEKIRRALPRVRQVSEQIKEGLRTTDVVRGAMPWLKTKIVYPYFVKFEMSPKPFRFTNSCTGCGTCARTCPLGNISMDAADDGHPAPQWGLNCALCLGCYHSCPSHAVAYGKITRNKGQKKILKH